MFLDLKPNVSKINVLSFYLMCFALYLNIQFIISFIIFILKSKEYYNVPPDNIGEITGTIGAYAEICIIGLDLVLGMIFDTFGRKLPTAFGFLILGTSIILMPFFTSIYPSFLILRILASIGILPGMNTPLLPDYI